MDDPVVGLVVFGVPLSAALIFVVRRAYIRDRLARRQRTAVRELGVETGVDRSERSEAVELPVGFFEMPRRTRLRHMNALSARKAVRRKTTREWIAHRYEDGDPAVIPALTRVLEADPDTAVRRSAAYGLSMTADEGAVSGLLIALQSSDRATRVHALKGLGHMRARQAVPLLVPLLDDWYWGAAAARALVAVQDERGLMALREAAARAFPWRRHRLKRLAAELERELGSAQDGSADRAR
jgi:HEAT repeat protein